MIGARLKELRKEKGITQKDLSTILGVQDTTISLYETGKHDPVDSVKVKISEYFNVSLDYLMGVVDKRVGPYNEENFLILTRSVAEDEKSLLQYFLSSELDRNERALLFQFMDFIIFMRNNNAVQNKS